MSVSRVLLALIAAFSALPGAGRAQAPQASAPATATWRDPLNHFTVEVPQGWKVRATEPGVWLMSGDDVEQDGAACLVNQGRNNDLPLSQAALDEVTRDPGYVMRQVGTLIRQWERPVPRLTIIGAPTERPYVIITMLANASRGRMALNMLMTWRPGSVWTVVCRVGEERMQAMDPQLYRIVSSFRTGETYGATNAR